MINFESLLNVSHNQFLLQKAIIGDNSDNIKGLDRVGEVKAKKYLSGEKQFTEEQKVIIERNLKIMDLSQGWQVNEPRERIVYEKQWNMEWPEPMKKVFFTLCMQYSLYEIISKPEQYDIFFKKQIKIKNIFLV